MTIPPGKGSGHSEGDPRPSATQGDESATGPVVDSRDLFAGARTVHISHAGQTYLLRITRENKLILTK